MSKYCGSIFQLRFFIFYIIFLPFISFSFIHSIHTRFISFFLFSFSCFSPPHKCPITLLLFSFSPQEHSNISHLLHIRERERERGCRKDKAGGNWRSPCSSIMSAAPPPLVVLPTTRLGQIGLFFFFFFFPFIFACSDSTLF